ncbi:hypothetical protein CALVIDRAFT_415686 [Calocera viscosa TUFC12733]|uniref:Uncharacterized protein n=1 Tax=Calocera viscosa (strain TUFC12733) TaxID=1330018 RepID=A0A167G0C4_CALVF|nr:hypothetical protein CALVIDRAFT_415686 [Calocera viscosa TUFC12733]
MMRAAATHEFFFSSYTHRACVIAANGLFYWASPRASSALVGQSYSGWSPPRCFLFRDFVGEVTSLRPLELAAVIMVRHSKTANKTDDMPSSSRSIPFRNLGPAHADIDGMPALIAQMAARGAFVVDILHLFAHPDELEQLLPLKLEIRPDKMDEPLFVMDKGRPMSAGSFAMTLSQIGKSLGWDGLHINCYRWSNSTRLIDTVDRHVYTYLMSHTAGSNVAETTYQPAIRPYDPIAKTLGLHPHAETYKKMAGISYNATKQPAHRNPQEDAAFLALRQDTVLERLIEAHVKAMGAVGAKYGDHGSAVAAHPEDPIVVELVDARCDMMDRYTSLLTGEGKPVAELQKRAAASSPEKVEGLASAAEASLPPSVQVSPLQPMLDVPEEATIGESSTAALVSGSAQSPRDEGVPTPLERAAIDVTTTLFKPDSSAAALIAEIDPERYSKTLFFTTAS